MKKLFYVAMSKKDPSRGRASCIASIKDEFDARVVAEFFREYRGHKIKRVTGDTMIRLMSTE